MTSVQLGIILDEEMTARRSRRRFLYFDSSSLCTAANLRVPLAHCEGPQSST